MKRTIGFIGLGRMGRNMVTRLLGQSIDVVVYNRTREVTEQFMETLGKPQPVAAQASVTRTAQVDYSGRGNATCIPAYEVTDLIRLTPMPRIIFLMIPNGSPIDEMLAHLVAAGLARGDTVIDGGNTYYKDTVRRAKYMETKGIHYIDCGTSGGLSGARGGACLMLGGDKPTVRNLSWLWEALATQGGWGYMGPSGSGHFVKMVHNGIEYGMNQAIGEGFEILAKGPYTLDFARIADIWSHGSVIRSWLVELLAQAFAKDPKLDTFSGKVGGGETGRWAEEAAGEFGVEVPVLKDAIGARQKSQDHPTVAGKVVSALRAGYGGHKEPK